MLLKKFLVAERTGKFAVLIWRFSHRSEVGTRVATRRSGLSTPGCDQSRSGLLAEAFRRDGKDGEDRCRVDIDVPPSTGAPREFV